MVPICRGEVKHLRLCLRTPLPVHPQISSVNTMVRSDQGPERELAHFRDKQEEALLKNLSLLFLQLLCCVENTKPRPTQIQPGRVRNVNATPSCRLLLHPGMSEGNNVPCRYLQSQAHQPELPKARGRCPHSPSYKHRRREACKRQSTPGEADSPKIMPSRVITRNRFQEN